MTISPFSYVEGPFYVYVISEPITDGSFEPIYVGRGRKSRAKTYFQPGRTNRLSRRYWEPKTHNRGLNAAISAVRGQGRDVSIYAYDCKASLSQAKTLEKRLIERNGRRDIKTGTLYNRNRGG